MRWNMNKLKITIIKKHFQYIHVSIQMEDVAESVFTTVHASHEEEGRKDIWRELKTIADSMNSSWLVCGDFNDIQNAGERDRRNPYIY